MKVVITYVIVIALAQYCLPLGFLIGGMTTALCLTQAPGRLRDIVTGTIGGVAGVAAAAGFGYLVFHMILGPNSHTTGAFFASILPLVIPLVRDTKRYRKLAIMENDFPGQTATVMKFTVVGYKLGFVLAILWQQVFVAR